MAIQKKAPGRELSDRAVRYHVVGKDHLETTMNETYDPMDFGADTAQRRLADAGAPVESSFGAVPASTAFVRTALAARLVNVKAARVAPVEAGSTGSALPLNGWYARGRSGRARAFWCSRTTPCLSLLRRESRAPC